MTILENRITINKPLNEVYDFIYDFKNIPRWNYYVEKVTEIPENGSDKKIYHQVRKNDEQTFVITESEFPALIKIETLNKTGIRFKRFFTFKASGPGKCIINDHFEVDFRIPEWMSGLAKNKMKKAVQENLFKLKELLEAGETVLQNGKLSIL